MGYTMDLIKLSRWVGRNGEPAMDGWSVSRVKGGYMRVDWMEMVMKRGLFRLISIPSP
jgi:hypothetical protein